MRSSFARPVDRDGLVIYFGIKDRQFLFNGHNGTFYDTFPDYALPTLRAVLEPGKNIDAAAAELHLRFGRSCEDLLGELRAYRDGTHQGLTPELRQEKFLHPMAPKIFNLYVAQGCNLSCRYCINQGGTFGRKPGFMSEDTAKNVLRFIAEIVRAGREPAISVNLFGGEPLLAPRTVRVLARGLQDLNHRNLPTKVHFFLSTNGTIYNKEIFDIFAERSDLCTVVISLDGFRRTHDRNRPFANPRRGSGYDAVVRNLSRMIESGIPYSVTCVVPYPYDFTGAAEALHRLGVRSLEMKRLIDHVYGRTVAPHGVFRQDLHLWRRKYLEYTDYYLDHLRTHNPVYHVDRFSVVRDYARALAAGTGSIRTLACGVADDGVAVTADGRIMPCDSFVGLDQLELGNVEQGFDPVRYQRFEKWILLRGQHRIEHRRCSRCYAKKLCGGGCYAVSYGDTERLAPLSGSSCRFIREMMRIDLYYISRLRKEHPTIYTKITGAPMQQ